MGSIKKDRRLRVPKSNKQQATSNKIYVSFLPKISNYASDKSRRTDHADFVGHEKRYC